MIKQQLNLEKNIKNLKLKNKKVLDVPKDGNCLFWATMVAYLHPVKSNENEFKKRYVQLFGNDEEWKQIFNFSEFDFKNNERLVSLFRQGVVKYMKDRSKKFGSFIIKENYKKYENYLSSISKNGTWGSEIEIKAISELLKIKIIVVKINKNVEIFSKTYLKKSKYNYKNEITIVNIDDSHYQFAVDQNNLVEDTFENETLQRQNPESPQFIINNTQNIGISTQNINQINLEKSFRYDLLLKEHQLLISAHNKLKAEKDNLLKESQDKDSELYRLEGEKNGNEETFFGNWSWISQEVQGKDNKIVDLSQKLIDKDNEIVTLRKKLENEQDKNYDLKKELENEQDKNYDLKKELENEQDKNYDLKKELENERKYFTEINYHLSCLLDEKDDLVNKLENIKTMKLISNNDEKNDDKVSHYYDYCVKAKFRKKFNELVNENEQLKNVNSKLVDDYNTLKDETAERIKDLEKDISLVNDEKDELVKENSNLKKQYYTGIKLTSYQLPQEDKKILLNNSDFNKQINPFVSDDVKSFLESELETLSPNLDNMLDIAIKENFNSDDVKSFLESESELETLSSNLDNMLDIAIKENFNSDNDINYSYFEGEKSLRQEFLKEENKILADQFISYENEKDLINFSKSTVNI